MTYDVDTTTAEGRRRLRWVANVCKGFGQRVQLSVFECRVTPAQLEDLEARLSASIDRESDSLRIYQLPGDRERNVKVHGRDAYTDFDGPLIV